MAGRQWPLPEPHKRWLLKSDLRRKELVESGTIRRWLSGPKLDEKPEVRKKWLLAPGPREPLPLRMKCKPWFRDGDRDRLPSSCFSRHNNKPGKWPASMDSRRWVPVKEGVDDFRTGCPSPEDVTTRAPREGFLPRIAPRIPRPPPKKTHGQPPKGAELCSKLSPAQPAQKAFAENTAASRSQDTLATSMKSEEDFSPGRLFRLLEELDVDSEPEDTREREKTPTHLCEEHPEEVNQETPKTVDLQPSKAVNLEPQEADKLEPAKKAHVESAQENLQLYLSSLLPEEETSHATDIPKLLFSQKTRGTDSEFCGWIVDNFGDIDIDEDYIMKKFATDFECPLTDNAVKIKETSHLPLNIRPNKQPDEIKQRKFSLQEDNWERKLRKPQDHCKPKREKIRYGAGYLDPKTWKKQVGEQPLPDPKVVCDKEHRSHGSHPEPDIIDELYGPIAFKDFVVNKGYEMSGMIEMFSRKGWKYENVKTPIHQVMKLLSKTREEDSGEEED